MGCEVIANTPVHCGSLQGNWHIMGDLLEMGLGPFGENPKQSIDIVLPNNLTFEDLYDPKDFREESFSLKLSTGHVHHKDGNPENNNPHNLILLCRDCHARIQSQLRNDMNKRKS